MHDAPVVTADGSYTLSSRRYGETYHSTYGALTEARHVFLDATGVSERLRQHKATRVLEIGFGLGLNALLTADLALQSGTPLVYHAFEHDLVSADTIRQLGYASLISNAPLFDALLGAVVNMHERYAGEDQSLVACRYQLTDDIWLVLHGEDATKADLTMLTDAPFDAIYLDAFSPDTNAECWDSRFICTLADVLAGNGMISTYSAKGDVRRALLAAGLDVKKMAGPPGKREMLVGRQNRLQSV